MLVSPVVGVLRLSTLRHRLYIGQRMFLLHICGTTGPILILAVLPGYRPPGPRYSSRLGRTPVILQDGDLESIGSTGTVAVR